MIVRKAKVKEAPKVVRLWSKFVEEHDKNVIKKNKKQIPHVTKLKGSQKEFEKYILRCIRSKNSALYVAEEDGKLIGYSLIHIKKNIPVFKIQKLGYFSDLYVEKEFRGKGVSKKFRDLGIIWFKNKGIKYISIAVYPENVAARSIYKKWGFFDNHIEMRSKI